MKRLVHLAAALALLTACAPRGEFAYGVAPENASLRELFVVEFRESDVLPGDRSPARPAEPSHTRLVVSVPPEREPGDVNLPGKRPDPLTDMIIVETAEYSDLRDLTNAVVAANPGSEEAILYIHGYNVNHPEAVYRTAQIAEDYDIPIPTLLFSWPSVAVPAGYAYDRDSVLYSRDTLAATIRAVTAKKKLVIVAHSMGAHLVMETLRQLDRSGFDVARGVNALILLSPDIDRDVFRSQATGIRTLPDPFVIVASEQDRVLRLSAFLTGRQQRIGSKADRTYVEGLPISIVDVSALSDGAFDHSVVTGSPAAIGIIRRITADRSPSELDLPGRAGSRRGGPAGRLTRATRPRGDAKSQPSD